MVSSSLDMQVDEVLAILERLRTTSSGDPEYQDLRSALPLDWPL
jgi:hypothetical protein